MKGKRERLGLSIGIGIQRGGGMKKVSQWYLLFRADLAAYGGCQARGRIGATAAGLRHSHSHSSARSELRLRPTPQLTAMLDPWPTERGQGSNPHPHGYQSDWFPLHHEANSTIIFKNERDPGLFPWCDDVRKVLFKNKVGWSPPSLPSFLISSLRRTFRSSARWRHSERRAQEEEHREEPPSATFHLFCAFSSSALEPSSAALPTALLQRSSSLATNLHFQIQNLFLLKWNSFR